MNDSAPLKHEEALRLLALAKEGDESAQELLVKRNIALVKSIIKKYLNRGVDYDDLFQIGCLGLVKAIKNYDPAYQVRFSTYAVPMIAGEVKRYLRDDGMVKVSRSLKELAIKVAAAQEKLNLRFGREAGIMEIAEETGADPGDIVMALEASRPHASIYDPVYGDDSDACVMDKLASDEDCESGIVNRILLKELLSQLDPRERQLIMMRYFMNKTQSDTAKELGVSQVQVSRLESKILKKFHLTHLGQPLGHLVGQGDGQGHQLRRLVAGVAKHHALVAGAVLKLSVLALLVLQRLIHAHGDVAGLLVNVGDNAAGVTVKAVLGPVIADVPDHFPGKLCNVHVATGADLAHDVHQAGGNSSLTGHPSLWVLGQNRVQHRVGNLVADLIGMSLCYGFRGK